MSFLKSILLGSEGSYHLWGIQVNFEEEAPSRISFSDLEGAGLVSKIAIQCINNDHFRWITQGYAHVFVHEVSHAIISKLIYNNHPSIRVFKSSCTGMCTAFVPNAHHTEWKSTIFSLAGPAGNIAFCSCKLVAAAAFKSYLSWPIALALGSGAVIWASGELLYAYTSALKRDSGDFGSIARKGNAHLTFASVILVSQCALAIFAAIMLSN